MRRNIAVIIRMNGFTIVKFTGAGLLTAATQNNELNSDVKSHREDSSEY